MVIRRANNLGVLLVVSDAQPHDRKNVSLQS